MTKILDIVKPGAVTGENLQKLFAFARENGFAFPSVNCVGTDSINAVIEAGAKAKSPVMVQFSNGGASFIAGKGIKVDRPQGAAILGAISGALHARNVAEYYGVPVVVHTDHCAKKLLPWIDGLLDAGEKYYAEHGEPLFSSHMIDLSEESLKDNVALCCKYLERMSKIGMTLELELGCTGGEEDGVIGMGECADPKECKSIADLGVDFLAAGIGNIHGKYPANWKGLSFETLAAVQELTGELPLVLHGGTGIPADQIKKAIDLGVSKINVNTECQLAFADATRKYIEAGKDLEGKGFDPRKLLAPGFEAIKATVKEKMELFGSVGKA